MSPKINNYKELGIRTDNLASAAVPWLILTIVFGIALIIILHSFPSLLQLWNQLYPSVAILMILATLQELFFRGYLIKVLRDSLNSPVLVILIDALLFAVMHLIFPQRIILVPEAFAAGIGFVTVYYFYPNVIWASVSHSLLNWLIIPFCYLGVITCFIR